MYHSQCKPIKKRLVQSLTPALLILLCAFLLYSGLTRNGLEGPEKFADSISRSKISNLVTTELIYSYILNTNGASIHKKVSGAFTSLSLYTDKLKWLFGPETIPGLSRNWPLARCHMWAQFVVGFWLKLKPYDYRVVYQHILHMYRGSHHTNTRYWWTKHGFADRKFFPSYRETDCRSDGYLLKFWFSP